MTLVLAQVAQQLAIHLLSEPLEWLLVQQLTVWIKKLGKAVLKNVTKITR